jgi:hypothetical protein
MKKKLIRKAVKKVRQCEQCQGSSSDKNGSQVKNLGA